MTQLPLFAAPDTTMLAHLYSPPDVEQAYHAWGAQCGPAACAAVLGVPVSSVRRCFPGSATRSWVNPTDMTVALRLAGRPFERLHTAWPSYGLVFVQWDGPWLHPGVPVGAAYRHTHWIGTARTECGRMVYDSNVWSQREHWGDWVPLRWWEQTIVPLLTAERPKATGGWHIRWSCRVHPAEER